MNLIKHGLLLACLGLLALNTLAAPLDLHGVLLDDSADVRGTRLQLNGAGTRYKGPFKVYVAGLYLPQKGSTLEEVISQPGPKRLSITMLRDIDAAELGKLLTRGMEDNMGKNDIAKLIPGLMRMSQIFSEQKKMLAGDPFMIEWLPGSGSVITVKGKVQGDAFKEPEFFKALLSIWLGPAPADFKLKDALLSIK